MLALSITTLKWHCLHQWGWESIPHNDKTQSISLTQPMVPALFFLCASELNLWELYWNEVNQWTCL